MASILLVDDDNDLRQMLSLILESLGHEVRQTEDASHAVDLVRHSRPDVVITDLLMPGLSGLKLIEQLRSANPGLKCLLISGDAEQAADLQPGGVDESLAIVCVPKPFTRAQISSAINALLASP